MANDVMEFDPLTLGETPEGYIENEDGSVDIPLEELGQVAVEESDDDFQNNLAEELPQELLVQLGSDYFDLAEIDKESRKKRDEQYEEGLRRTGLGDDAPGGAQFEGASRVVHPVLTEACIDFSSRAIKELFPSAGPVKSFIIGEHTPAKTDKAQRKTRYMNWQLTTQISEYRSELEQLLVQLPMGGSQFQKFYHDPRLGRTRTEFAPVDQILLPFEVADFYSAERVTHRYFVTRQTFKNRVESGLYRDAFITFSSSMPEQTNTEIANDKIEGKEENGYNEDGLRAILEIYVYLEIPDDKVSGGKYAPYIMTVDEDTKLVLSIYRNWAPEDWLLRKLDWLVEWKFIPWRGAYGIGLPHIIGDIAAAMTGALRALLDSAHINNMPGLIKLKGARTVGQNKTISATSITEVEASGAMDDVRKVIMPLPYNQPSAVLSQLLGELYGLAKNTVAAADDKIAQLGDRTPVGTTMALIEQGSQVYSAIHARLHASQKRALEIIHRLNAQYLDEEREEFELGEVLVTRDDFIGTMDVIPVSDPTIFSEAQRFAQTQALVQMSQDQSVPWNKINIYRRALKQMRIENIEELLPETKEPITADFIAENFALMKGTPIKATIDQDHATHLQGHLGWLMDPLTQGNPFNAPQMLMTMLQHVAEHVRMFQEAAYQAAEAMPDEASKLQLVAGLQPQIAQILQPYMQTMSQLHQAIQQKMPPPQMPPEVQASIEIAKMDTQRKAQYDQAMLQAKQQEFGAEQQAEAAKLQQTQQMETARLQQAQQAEALRLQADQQQAIIDAQMLQQREAFNQQMEQAKLSMTQQLEGLRQQVELMKNKLDNQQKSQTELQKNDDDNRTSMIVNQMREDAATERAVLVESMRQEKGNGQGS